MRLRTCIALELLVGISTLSGLGVGVGWALDGRGRQVATAPVATFDPDVDARVPRGWFRADRIVEKFVASATASPALPLPAPGAASPAIATTVAPVETSRAADLLPASATATVFDLSDAELLATIADAPVAAAKLNRGGTSLSLRLDFANGAQAAFKPEQVHAHSQPRREIAAYRFDRLLGLGHVPPAMARDVPFTQLVALLGPGGAERVKLEAMPKNGRLAGEVSWWVPVLKDAQIEGFNIDDTEGIVTWRRYLKVGAAIPAKYRGLLHQISDMTLFDFVIDNLDRWSGSNAKVSPDGKVLYFMDNTFSFPAKLRPTGRSRLYLERTQVFSRRLVERLRTLSEAELRAALAQPEGSPIPQLLTKGEIAAVMVRRDAALKYVDQLIAAHGEAAVLVFP